MSRTSNVTGSVVASSMLHACLLLLVSFSFPASNPGGAQLVFLGNILPSRALIPAVLPHRAPGALSLRQPLSLPGPLAGRRILTGPAEADKPAAGLVRQKFLTVPAAAPEEFPEKNRESVLMFHPLLPYQLQMYFKDRAAVHIELMFNIVSDKNKNYIAVKRRISSGNLDADLLCSRQISHYLFIQRARFDLNKWQTVKIDLSKQREE